jgi:hypothetical protein
VSEQTITLVPHRLEDRAKGFALTEREYKLGVELVSKTGFTMNTHAGFADRRSAGLFGRILAAVLEQKKKIAEEDKVVLRALATFLQTHGGCSLERGWRRLNHGGRAAA